jgi:maltodextrin utilization protein YvdJ
MKLVALPAIALLMLPVSASAASLATRDAVSVTASTIEGAQDVTGCSLSRPFIQTDSPLLLTPTDGKDAAVDTVVADNPWAPGASSHWNAGMNRAVDHLLAPPAHVKVFATQTGTELRGHYEGSQDPNETFAAFEIVIH